MASLTGTPQKGYRILFSIAANDRRGFRIPRMSEKKAKAIQEHVEEIVRARQTGQSVDRVTQDWLARIAGTKLEAKLVTAGLIASREPVVEKAKPKLKEFLDRYIQEKAALVKNNTTASHEQGRDRLVAHFGEDRALDSITAADASRWLTWLKTEGRDGEGFADATTAKAVQLARQFFAYAVDDRLIDVNPFAKLKKVGSMVNKNKKKDLSRADAQKVLDACPNTDWRLIFALARFGGLRCPSEVLALRWGDVDIAAKRMNVPVPKLIDRRGREIHEGKGKRLVPIFPELMPILREASDAADERVAATGRREEYVVMPAMERKEHMNLNTGMRRIIEKAGLTPWPAIFNSLRSTRETELAEVFPLHVVAAWIGNSPKIAIKHYLGTTDSHFDRATAHGGVTVSQIPAHSEPTGQPTKTSAESTTGKNARKTSTDGKPWQSMSVNPESYFDCNGNGEMPDFSEEKGDFSAMSQSGNPTVAFSDARPPDVDEMSEEDFRDEVRRLRAERMPRG